MNPRARTRQFQSAVDSLMNNIDSQQIVESESQASPAELFNTLLGTFVRRRWWVLTTFATIVVLSLLILARTPNRYTSEAMIVVARQRVPERYVVPTSTTDLEKDLRTMESEVLSRSRLLSMINEFALYPKERKRLAPEELVELIRHDIQVEPLVPKSDPKGADSFTISFTGESPIVAQEVTSRMASLFILNDVKGREDQAQSTTKFLREHLDTTQQKLTSMQENLREFKLKHLGELPEQQQGNLAILTGLETQLQNTTSAIARAQQQRVYLESLINTLRSVTTKQEAPLSHTTTQSETEPDEALLGSQLRLARLRNDQKVLSASRQPGDPELVKLNVDIARTEALLQKLRAEKPPAEKVSETQDASVAQLESQLEANRLELQNLTRDEKQLKIEVSEYQTRLNQTPIREQQLAGMAQELDLVKQQYADLLTKEQQSQLATSLEEQQGGQQFRLLEPPNLPVVPSSPQRNKIAIGVFAAALVLGLGVGFLVELKNRAFYTEKELTEHYSVPLVVGMPLVLTPNEKKQRKWRSKFEWAAGLALTIVAFTAEVLYVRMPDILGNIGHLGSSAGIH